jgi:excisionase family DNA binding protein
MAQGGGRSKEFVWLHTKLLYTFEDCEALLSLSRSQLYRLADGGTLETVKVGKSRRITHTQLDAFVKLLEQSGGSISFA